MDVFQRISSQLTYSLQGMYNIDDKIEGHWVKAQGQAAMAVEML